MDLKSNEIKSFSDGFEDYKIELREPEKRVLKKNYAFKKINQLKMGDKCVFFTGTIVIFSGINCNFYSNSSKPGTRPVGNISFIIRDENCDSFEIKLHYFIDNLNLDTTTNNIKNTNYNTNLFIPPYGILKLGSECTVYASIVCGCTHVASKNETTLDTPFENKPNLFVSVSDSCWKSYLHIRDCDNNACINVGNANNISVGNANNINVGNVTKPVVGYINKNTNSIYNISSLRSALSIITSISNKTIASSLISNIIFLVVVTWIGPHQVRTIVNTSESRSSSRDVSFIEVGICDGYTDCTLQIWEYPNVLSALTWTPFQTILLLKNMFYSLSIPSLFSYAFLSRKRGIGVDVNINSNTNTNTNTNTNINTNSKCKDTSELVLRTKPYWTGPSWIDVNPNIPLNNSLSISDIRESVAEHYCLQLGLSSPNIWIDFMPNEKNNNLLHSPILTPFSMEEISAQKFYNLYDISSISSESLLGNTEGVDRFIEASHSKKSLLKGKCSLVILRTLISESRRLKRMFLNYCLYCGTRRFSASNDSSNNSSNNYLCTCYDSQQLKIGSDNDNLIVNSAIIESLIDETGCLNICSKNCIPISSNFYPSNGVLTPCKVLFTQSCLFDILLMHNKNKLTLTYNEDTSVNDTDAEKVKKSTDLITFLNNKSDEELEILDNKIMFQRFIMDFETFQVGKSIVLLFTTALHTYNSLKFY